jgi:hypothetical protein
VDHVLDGVILFSLLSAWGAQAVGPWRISAVERRLHRRAWSYAAPLLLLAGVLAGLALLVRHPDAAIAAGLAPLTRSVPGKLLVALVPGLLAVDLISAKAGRGLEDRGWWIAAGCGLATVGAACWAGELLRTGEGPESPPTAQALLIGCLMLLALAAGEQLAPGRPVWAAAAGPALLAYLFLLPPEVNAELRRGGIAPTAIAAALLLATARWLPVSLRRIALGAGVLLAAFLLLRAGAASQALGAQPILSPLPPLPKPN